MSCYVNFFIKVGDRFAPIGSFSRSSAIYAAFEEAPWEKVRPLTMAKLTSVLGEQEENLRKWKDSIDEQYQRKQLIATFNNSVEDKMEALYEVDESIKESRETIDELEQAAAFTRTLIWIVDEADSSKYYEEEAAHFDPNNYLYYGMETGPIPEIED